MKFPSIEELRHRATRKWTEYPDDVIPLWIAESDFPTCPNVLHAIQEAVDRESFGYPPASSHLPGAVADFYANFYGWRPRADRIVAVADVVRGMVLAVQYLTRPDSAVVVPVPSYPPFLQIPDVVGREAVYVGAEGGLDLGEIEAAFAKGAGCLLLASPNNPMGYTYSRDFLSQLVELAARYDARVIVDEIHAPIVYEGHNVPAAGVSELAGKVCVTVTATSKAWNIAGLKCAQVIFSNEDDWKAWNAIPPIAREGVSTLGIAAATESYHNGEAYLENELSYLRENRDYLVEVLPQRIPGLKVVKPQATYLLWLDFRETPIATDPAGFMLRNAKVALNDGATFGPGGKGFARLNFATSREILDKAIDRMAAAMQEAEG